VKLGKFPPESGKCIIASGRWMPLAPCIPCLTDSPWKAGNTTSANTLKSLCSRLQSLNALHIVGCSKALELIAI